jgi:predicted GNAT superfamily acetyltransferase
MVKFRIDEAVSQETASELWPLYDSVFGDYADFETWHRSVWAKHSVREGFCLARAYDGDSLVGFAYGYTGERGQWWTDNVRPVLEPEVAEIHETRQGGSTPLRDGGSWARAQAKEP